MCSPNGFFGPGQKTKREVIDFLPSPFPPQCQIGANFINWRQRMSIFLRYPFVVMSQSSHSIWYLCSWEDQERENEQGNEKSILEQLQQTLLGKMVKFSWSLVSLLCCCLLPSHCQHDFLFLNLNDGPKVPEGHWWLKAKLKRDWWTCQACFLGRNLNFQLSTAAAIDLWQMTALEKCCWSTQNNHHFHQAGKGLVFWRTHLGM